MNLKVNIAIAFFSVAAFLVLIEGGARVFYEKIDGENCFTAHPQARYQYAPNCSFNRKLIENDSAIEYKFNSCGYRSPSECYDIGPNAIGIVTLGDSFMMGAMSSIEDHFMAQMIANIKSALRTPIEIDWQNLGTEGYDPLQYFHRLDEALRMRPKLLVVGLTPNDFYGDSAIVSLAEQTRSSWPSLSAPSESNTGGRDIFSTLKWLMSHSRFLELASMHLFANDRVFYEVSMLRGGNNSYLSKSYSETWKKRISIVASILDKMNAKAKSNGCLLSVVLIPQRIQQTMLTVDYDQYDLDPYALGNALRHMSVTLQIPFFDALNAFPVDDHKEDFYFPLDGHLTSAGNRFIGDYLSNSVVKDKKIRTIFTSGFTEIANRIDEHDYLAF